MFDILKKIQDTQKPYTIDQVNENEYQFSIKQYDTVTGEEKISIIQVNKDFLTETKTDLCKKIDIIDYILGEINEL